MLQEKSKYKPAGKKKAKHGVMGGTVFGYGIKLLQACFIFSSQAGVYSVF
jgi:hypothetical protein